MAKNSTENRQMDLNSLLGADSSLHIEYQEQKDLYDAQPNSVRIFLDAQARKIDAWTCVADH